MFICAFWFVCVPPFCYVSLSSWVISLTVFGASVTNVNDHSRALSASTVAWVRSYLHPFWAVVNKSNAGWGGYYVAGRPLLNGRCTSLLRAPRLRNGLYCVEWDVKLYYTYIRHCLRPYNPVHTVYMNVMFFTFFYFYPCYLCENKWWWWWMHNIVIRSETDAQPA